MQLGSREESSMLTFGDRLPQPALEAVVPGRPPDLGAVRVAAAAGQ